MNQRTTHARKLSGILAAAALLLTGASRSEAARPPAGRTYYTVLVGVANPYDISTACFDFGPSSVCSTDGGSCGSWLRTDARGKKTGFTFDMSLLEDGVLVRLDGEGQTDTAGRKSSIGGAGRVSGVGPRFNYSFAGREVSRDRCEQMLDEGASNGNGGAGTIIVGSGNVVSEPRSVSGFSKVALSGVGRLEIRHTGSESLTVRADDNLFPYLRSEVHNGTLILGNEPDVNLRTDNDIVYVLTVRDIDTLTVAGVTWTDIRGIDSDQLTVSISGVAVVEAKGRADRQRITVTGVGIYQASDLDSRIVDIDISGVSEGVVRASEQLNGSVRGVSTLEYIGEPAVNVVVDPGSSLRRIR